MAALKPIAKHSIQRAIERAERYRLLNEPWDAESICLDVLAVEENNPQALTCLLLSLTDQLQAGDPKAMPRAREVLQRLPGEYERAYYAGIICERSAKRAIKLGQPNARFDAYVELQQAMAHYEAAEKLAAGGNDDPVLRYNACARLIEKHDLVAPHDHEGELPLE